MNVRAKFRITNITLYESPEETGSVRLAAVYANRDGSSCAENKAFWSATPSGTLEMHINNPAAFKEFKEAFHAKRDVYIDFTLAPA
jgi:hypothetical protein